MSDISGPPIPKPIEPVTRTTGKTGSVSKDPQQAQTEARDNRGETSSKSEQSEQLRAREPAVSISASAAHLEIGEKLKEQVKSVDSEGRPIIVTETATFALRPDAGLRPGDDVRLEIVEAGQKLAADLLERNGQPIKPPVRLSLIVIAIHAQEATTAAPSASGTTAVTAGHGYAPTKNILQSKAEEATATNDLATVLGAKTAASATAATEAEKASRAALAQTSKANLPHVQETERITGNPDYVANRNSSPDLATLIDAQQRASQRLSGYSQPQPEKTETPAMPDKAHLIPPSSLTAIAPADSEDNGLGQPGLAYSATGQALFIQLIDPSVSEVSPQQLAKVISVRPMPQEQVMALKLPITAFEQNDSPLASVETDKGTLIMPLRQAAHLTGEQIRVSSAPSAQTAENTPDTAIRYPAKLYMLGESSGRPVSMAILADENAGSATVSNTASVTAVHTIRAFLSPQGPKTDFRIETDRGELVVTLPGGVRPSVNDVLHILEQPKQQIPPVPPLSPAAELATGTALSTLGMQQWPALEQGFATVTAVDPAVAHQFASRSAQGGGRLTNSLLFFLAAAGRGDPGMWLGKEAEHILANRNGALLETLKNSISRLMGVATDTTAEWRPIMLPMDMKTSDMPFIALLLGHGQKPLDPNGGNHKGSEDARDDDTVGRFILEVRFSVLGAVQLDGLVRKQNFDLAMRTEKNIPGQLKHEAVMLFDEALAANGFSGRMTIQERTPFPVNVDTVLQSSFNTAS